MSKIALIGCGSVGSTLADTIVRLGHNITYLIDNDIVEKKNISKSVYTMSDINNPKVDALKRHLEVINPELKIRTISMFMEDLSDDEWELILKETDMILEMADSRSGSEICVSKLKEYYEATGRQHILIKMVCLDNISAGLTMVWLPGTDLPCPCCLFKATPFVNTSDERSGKNDANYTSDRITGHPISGVLPDMLYGLSLTSSLIHGLLLNFSGGTSGRDALLASFIDTTISNIQLWSPFRDPFLDWQKESREHLMGSVAPLYLKTKSPCIFCGLNIEETQANEEYELEKV